MWLKSQNKYNCLINTNNVTAIRNSENSNGFSICADAYKLCEYESEKNRDKVYGKLESIVIEGKLISYELPEEWELNKED